MKLGSPLVALYRICMQCVSVLVYQHNHFVCIQLTQTRKFIRICSVCKNFYLCIGTIPFNTTILTFKLRVYLSFHYYFVFLSPWIICVTYRIRFPGFNLRVVCFNPNLQDVQGCTATPINQLSNTLSGRKKRNTDIVMDHQSFSSTVDISKQEELMDEFIKKVTPNAEQVQI